jgi:hypothetical protein
MEQFTKQFEQMFNVDTIVDQTEKSVASVLTYLPQADVKETLFTLNAANANFARANLVAAKAVGKAFQSAAEQAQKSLKTAASK